MSLHGNQLLVCGDQRGNLASFKFPSNLLLRHSEESLESPSQLQSIGVFKGAHGISAVASVSVTSSSNNQDAIITSVSPSPWIFLLLIFIYELQWHLLLRVFSDLLLFSGFFIVWALTFMMRCRQAGMAAFANLSLIPPPNFKGNPVVKVLYVRV